MKRSLILSNLRIELRKKNADYNTEKVAQKWVKEFLDDLSIVHSSQIRNWQRDLFLTRIQTANSSKEEILQAKSALLFLYERVLKKSPGIRDHSSFEDHESEPGVFKITA